MRKDKIEEKEEKKSKSLYRQMLKDLNQAKKQAGLGYLGKVLDHIELAKEAIKIITGV